MKRILFLLIAFISIISIVSATDYYISPTGSDAAAGTSIGAAWANISKCASMVTAGDTCWVINGTYSESGIEFTNNGTAVNPIKMKTYNGTASIISSTYSSFVENNSQYIQIDGFFNMSGGAGGVDFRNSTGIVIRNTTVQGTNTANQGAIWFRGGTHDSIIENNTVYNVQWNGIMIYGSTWGIHLSQTSGLPVYNITIKNNTVRDSSVHNGIDIHGNNYNITVENNTVYNLTGQIGIFAHSADSTLNRDIIIKNNTVHDNGKGIYIHSSYNVSIDGNIIYNHTGNDLYGIGIAASWEDPGTPFNPVYNVTVINNTAYNNYYNMKITNTNSTYYNPNSDYIFGISVIDNNFYNGTHLTNSVDSWVYDAGNVTFKDNNINLLNRLFYSGTGSQSYDILYESDYIFTENGSTPSPKYYTTIANTTSKTSTYITTYLTHLQPAADYLENVVVNQYNTSADVYNYTIASSIAENPTWINATVSSPSATYNLAVDGVYYDTAVSGADSIVRFFYDEVGNEWDASHSFNITLAGAQLIDETKLYSGMINTIYSNGTIGHSSSTSSEQPSNLMVVVS